MVECGGMTPNNVRNFYADIFNERVANSSSIIACVYDYIFAGINEADGNERLATLGVLVLQVFHLYAHFGFNYDGVFPHKTRKKQH